MNHIVAGQLSQPIPWRLARVEAGETNLPPTATIAGIRGRCLELAGICLLYLLGTFPWLILMYFWVEF